MGRLEKGQWIVESVNPETSDGEFKRQEQKFRQRIGSCSQSSPTVFPAEKARYHLYVAYACPWAHRTLIMRELKGLQDIISLSVLSPDMLADGWSFEENFNGVIPDSVFQKRFLREVYTTVDPNFTGRVTVPVLLDKKNKKIVNNESSEIVRIFNTAFDEITGNKQDYYPKESKEEIDKWNNFIYENINNGVYKTGFARTQAAYERNANSLFSALDQVNEHLSSRTYLVDEVLTEADIRLWTTLIRFDSVYHVHFKCNRKYIRDFPALSRFTGMLYNLPAFSKTTHFNHIQRHYYYSHESINPFRIIPQTPFRHW